MKGDVGQVGLAGPPYERRCGPGRRGRRKRRRRRRRGEEEEEEE